MTDQSSVSALAMEERGLLAKRQSGKQLVFRAAGDLEARLGGQPARGSGRSK